MTQEQLGQVRICIPGTASDNIILDKEFQRLVPKHSDGERAGLYRSMDEMHGCRDALKVWKGHDILVDGYTRIGRSREMSYPFPVLELEFADRKAVKKFIMEEQTGRRNLSELAMMHHRGTLYEEQKCQGARHDLTSGNSYQKSTAEVLAELFLVSEKKIRNDYHFARAVEKLCAAFDEECRDDIRDILLAREMKLTASLIRDWAKKPVERQRELIAYLKEHGKPPRQSRKAKGPKTITVRLQAEPLLNAVLGLGPAGLAKFKKLLAAEDAKKDKRQAQEGNGRRGRNRKVAEANL